VTAKPRPPLRPGDIVVPRDDLEHVKIWGYEGKLLTVAECHASDTSSTGWVVTTQPEKCPHCGHVQRPLVGYSSDWFVLRRRAER
jgi:hypothetical protein